MNLPIQAVQVPLFDDGDGGLRVVGTRVLLERIVYAYERGDSPKEIVEDYDTLCLPDVYAILSWFLRHQEDVAEYMRMREAQAERNRIEIEARQPDRTELRARLKQHLAQQGIGDDSPAE